MTLLDAADTAAATPLRHYERCRRDTPPLILARRRRHAAIISSPFHYACLITPLITPPCRFIFAIDTPLFSAAIIAMLPYISHADFLRYFPHSLTPMPIGISMFELSITPYAIAEAPPRFSMLIFRRLLTLRFSFRFSEALRLRHAVSYAVTPPAAFDCRYACRHIVERRCAAAPCRQRYAAAIATVFARRFLRCRYCRRAAIFIAAIADVTDA